METGSRGFLGCPGWENPSSALSRLCHKVMDNEFVPPRCAQRGDVSMVGERGNVPSKEGGSAG